MYVTGLRWMETKCCGNLNNPELLPQFTCQVNGRKWKPGKDFLVGTTPVLTSVEVCSLFSDFSEYRWFRYGGSLSGSRGEL